MTMDNDNIIDILDADGRANLKPKRYKRKYGNDEPAAGDISELLQMQIKALKSGGGIVKYADDPGGLDAFIQKSVRFLEYVNDYNGNAEQENKPIIVPSVEAWASFLCISRVSLLNYEKRGGNWKTFIETFRNGLQAVKLQMASRGKMPPLIYIFDATNNGTHYANTSEFKLSDTESEKREVISNLDRDALAKKYGFDDLSAPDARTGSGIEEQQENPE